VTDGNWELWRVCDPECPKYLVTRYEDRKVKFIALFDTVTGLALRRALEAVARPGPIRRDERARRAIMEDIAGKVLHPVNNRGRIITDKVNRFESAMLIRQPKNRHCPSGWAWMVSLAGHTPAHNCGAPFGPASQPGRRLSVARRPGAGHPAARRGRRAA
jgi:hypothetical protein